MVEADRAALDDLAAAVLERLHARGLRIVTSESCTGGLIASLLTDVEGCSHVFERGFVAYSEDAKTELLGISPEMIAVQGAVSEAVVVAMAQGALERSRADLSVAVTGYAGPRQGSEEVGLVHLAVAMADGLATRKLHLGERGRSEIRDLTARHALALVHAVLRDAPNRSSQKAGTGN